MNKRLWITIGIILILTVIGIVYIQMTTLPTISAGTVCISKPTVSTMGYIYSAAVTGKTSFGDVIENGTVISLESCETSTDGEVILWKSATQKQQEITQNISWMSSEDAKEYIKGLLEKNRTANQEKYGVRSVIDLPLYQTLVDKDSYQASKALKKIHTSDPQLFEDITYELALLMTATQINK